MEKQAKSKKSVILWAVWLSVAAAAAFFSMSAFTRTVFNNEWQWQLSFAVLAGCLLLSAAFKRPLVSLFLAIASAVILWFFTRFYAPLFFPVALQAVLWEAARSETKTGRAAFVLALLLIPSTIPQHIRLWDYLTYNDYGKREPLAMAILCAVGLLILLGLYVWLLVQSLREAKMQKKALSRIRRRNKKSSPLKGAGQQQELYTRMTAVFAVCAINIVSTGVQCAKMCIGSLCAVFVIQGCAVALPILSSSRI